MFTKRRLVICIIAVIMVLAMLIPAVGVYAYTQTSTSTIVVQTDTGTATFNGSQWSFLTDTQIVQAGYYSSAYYQMSTGMRFTNIQIPQGATINQAYLQFTAYSDSTLANQIPVQTTIVGQASSYPATFINDNYTDYMNSRPKTSAQVQWQINRVWTPNQTIQSPDLTNIIQEDVQRSDWASGGAIVLFWGDFSGQTYQQNGYCRRAYGFGGTGDPPTLVINYTWNGTTSTTTGLYYYLNGQYLSYTGYLPSGATLYYYYNGQYLPYNGTTTGTADVAQLQTQLTTIDTDVKNVGNTLATINQTVSSLPKTTDIQQTVTNSLATDSTLVGLNKSLTNATTQMTQLNTTLSTVDTSIKAISDKEDAIQAQLKALQDKGSGDSGYLIFIVILLVIVIVLLLAVFGALRRQA